MILMTEYNREILDSAHKHTFKNKTEILQSVNCSCFYCMKVFRADDIIEWVDEEQTAMCPLCSIDAVLGDKSGFPVNDMEFLKQMHARWF